MKNKLLFIKERFSLWKMFLLCELTLRKLCWRVCTICFSLLFLMLGISNLSLASPAENAQKLGDYLLWTSGVSDPREAPIYWIDDETLLFSGVPGEKVSDEKLYKEVVKARLFTWKLGEKPKVFLEDRWQSESGKSRFYCADYESIHFSDLRLNDLGLGEKYHTQIIKGKEVKVFLDEYRKFEINKEPIKPLPYYQKKNKKYIGRALTNINDRDYCPGRTDAKMEGRYWQDSSHGEYYLDLAARDFFTSMKDRKPSDDETVRLIKQDTWESWEINLPIRMIDRSTIQHFQGTESFFVAGRRPRHLEDPSWKESNCWSFWLVLTKDKKAEKFCLPYGEWSVSGSTFFMDTKAGPFFYIHHQSKPGLYSYNNSKPIKVFKGYLLKTRVSPSGCKIAFSSIPSVKEIILGRKFLITHYVLDVCTSLKGNSGT